MTDNTRLENYVPDIFFEEDIIKKKGKINMTNDLAFQILTFDKNDGSTLREHVFHIKDQISDMEGVPY